MFKSVSTRAPTNAEISNMMGVYDTDNDGGLNGDEYVRNVTLTLTLVLTLIGGLNEDEYVRMVVPLRKQFAVFDGGEGDEVIEPLKNITFATHVLGR